MSDKELKPCPFCGSKPKFFKPKDFEEQEQIYCCPNGCTAGLTKDEWNTRPTPPLVGLDEDRVVKFLESEGVRTTTQSRLYLAKAICAKFGSPQKEPLGLEKVLEGVEIGAACSIHGFKAIQMSEGDGHPATWHDFCELCNENSKGGEEPPTIISGEEYLRTHWPNPDPRFVEVGKIELPKKLTHINQVPPMDSTMKACGYFDGWNNAIYACKAAVEAAGLEYGLDKRKKGKEK